MSPSHHLETGKFELQETSMSTFLFVVAIVAIVGCVVAAILWWLS